MPKVSVVVPIYNVEKYLRQCLDSIVAQTLYDIEIILVNDGSTDSSPKIIEEFAQKDKRIVVIDQKNGGLGKAYNAGINAAKGEYIGLVESDDWIEPDMFALLYKAAAGHNADIVKAPFWRYDSTQNDERKRNVLVKLKSGEKTLLDFSQNAPKDVFTIDDLPLLAAYPSSLWSNLYHADFVRQIPFKEHRGAGYPDTAFVFEVLCRAQSIVAIPNPVLHWRNEGSTQRNSSSSGGPRVLNIIDRFADSLAIIKKYGKYEIGSCLASPVFFINFLTILYRFSFL
jgi:glycosyltransferase involved in cell wall biosynthesis